MSVRIHDMTLEELISEMGALMEFMEREGRVKSDGSFRLYDGTSPRIFMTVNYINALRQRIAEIKRPPHGRPL
jgi:hypothetical protein